MAIDVGLAVLAVACSVAGVVWVVGRVVADVLDAVGSLVRRVESGDGIGEVVEGPDLFGVPDRETPDWTEAWLGLGDSEAGWSVPEPDLAGEELEL